MLELRNLTKIYEINDKQIVALKNVNVVFGKSGFVVILGKSGSGKSTLLNLIGGLDEPTSGDIIFKGNSLKDFTDNQWDEYRNTFVGFVFQDFNLLEEYSVKKNIALSLELIGYPKAQIDQRVKEILVKIQLEGLEKRKPKELSGGQRQRVTLARALVKTPSIILCDEPTGNLDTATGKLILDTLKVLSKDHLVIMVTHDEEFAKNYGERIIELKDGEIIRDIENNPEKNIIETPSGVIFDISKDKSIPESVINYLNDKLEQADNDLYLTLYRKTALPRFIDVKKAQDVNIETGAYISEPLILKKPKFHFKNWIKLAFHNLITKKVKLALMLFLFTLSLTFVGVGLTLSLYDAQEAAYQTFQKGNITIIPFVQNYEDCRGSVINCGYDEIGMNLHDIEALQKAFPTLNIFLTDKYSGMSISNGFHEENLFYQDFFTRIGYLDSDKNLDYIGTFPESSKQVLITDYMALMIRHFGYHEVETDEELIGKQLPNGYEITGIVKTDFEKYYGVYNYQNINEDFIRNYYELYGMLFVNLKEHTYDDLPTSFSTAFFIGKDSSYDGPYSNLTASRFFNKTYIGTLPQKENEIMITKDYAYSTLGFIGEDISSLIGTKRTFSYLCYGYEDYNSSSYSYEPYEFTITGIIVDDTVTDNIFVLSDAMYEHIEKRNDLTRGMAILGDDEKENRAFVNLLDYKQYSNRTVYRDQLADLPVVFMMFKVPLYILGTIFTVVAGIIIYYFISASIESKQKELGILRAIGTTGWDIGKIFITESVLIILFTSTIASILTGYFIKKIDTIITKGLKIRGIFYIDIKGFDLDIIFLYVNYWAILLVFMISLLVVFIAVYVPIKRIAKTKPIKVIKRIV